MNKHYQIVIIGGGTAGVTVASRLLRKNQNLKEKIAIIDPADHPTIMDVGWCRGI
ncbi:FAD-dependent pyridine nucleotide-disulfide oxidoreductase [Staphylococcus aureus]|nr:FAD-dependent pyridine nucleotide-disulfide oxidoreductase [Staphylococcus aureus]CAC7224197.1 FAD-dependent pyridine nucleotide-disulfide oxidoreductase [Staphylococcus aureus]